MENIRLCVWKSLKQKKRVRKSRFFGQSNGRDEVDSLTTSEESFAARDLREARQLFYTHNIHGLIMAQANKQRKGKVRKKADTPVLNKFLFESGQVIKYAK